ncbi:hypothetical protein Sjap_018400 [Stephania japonica]|uniref:FAR1 domain-containing protein n=1 Tax=Stephania japonica TaxID=461633 RepID=A0AAP0I820_9MAGN
MRDSTNSQIFAQTRVNFPAQLATTCHAPIRPARPRQRHLTAASAPPPHPALTVMEPIIDLNEPMEATIHLDSNHVDNFDYGLAEAIGSTEAVRSTEAVGLTEAMGSIEYSGQVVIDNVVEGSNTATAPAPAPEMDMIFDSPKHVKIFFNQYAKRIGFAIKVRSIEKKENGVVWKYVFTCAKQGHKKMKGLYKLGGLTSKCGCHSQVKAKLFPDGKWHLTLVVLSEYV